MCVPKWYDMTQALEMGRLRRQTQNQVRCLTAWQSLASLASRSRRHSCERDRRIGCFKRWGRRTQHMQAMGSARGTPLQTMGSPQGVALQAMGSPQAAHNNIYAETLVGALELSILVKSSARVFARPAIRVLPNLRCDGFELSGSWACAPLGGRRFGRRDTGVRRLGRLRRRLAGQPVCV